MDPKLDYREAIFQKMKKEGMNSAFIESFLRSVDKVAAGDRGIVDWGQIGELLDEDSVSLSSIHESVNPDFSNLGKLVIIKLNGGLGTSMGLSTPKSVMEVKQGNSFLKVVARQVEYLRQKYSVEIPLLLMDSFSTVEACQRELAAIGFRQNYRSSFAQHKVPRLLQENLLPFFSDVAKKEWCPPGHGDIFYAIDQSGALDDLLDNGFEYAFISNVDNLGATVDPFVLQYMVNKELDFAIEMTPKTQADRKGGTLVRNAKGGMSLLEVAQVPADKMNEFLDIRRFRNFNTNNIWLDLRSLKKRLLQGDLDLSLIVNPKNIEGTDIIQLETAMGSAIGCFARTEAIIVPRERFAPVKKCDDFLARRSDAYVLNEEFSLVMNPSRIEKNLGEVVIQLDESVYKKFNDFEMLFPVYPSLVDCISFIVTGDVEFDISVVIRGDVGIENHTGQRQKISSLNKTVFENEIVKF